MSYVAQMVHPSNSLNPRNDLLLWALALSLALHSAALGLLPGFSFKNVIKTEEPLTVELQQLPPPPKVLEPEKPKSPEPPKPEPVKPKLEKPLPKPEPVAPPPAPVVTPPPRVETPPPVAAVEPSKAAPPPSPPVIAVEQKTVESPPTFTAPATSTEPNNDGLGEVRAAYGRLLKDEFTKYTKYPPVALMKGWEGRVTIRLQVDKEGNVIGTPKVIEGSGHTMLDEDAVKAILKNSPLPLPPTALHVKPIFINTTLDYHKPR